MDAETKDWLSRVADAVYNSSYSDREKLAREILDGDEIEIRKTLEVIFGG